MNYFFSTEDFDRNEIFWTTVFTHKIFNLSLNVFADLVFFSHRPQIILFMHSKFTNDPVLHEKRLFFTQKKCTLVV